MTKISEAFIKQLPKTDLHCHFDGSIRIGTLIDFAKRRKVPLFSFDPTILMEHMKYGRVRKSLEEYLAGFAPLISVLQDADDIERAYYEVCEDAAAENVWHIELRYCPYLHTKNKLTEAEVVECCVRASDRAEKNLGISVRQILCGLKNDAPSYVLEIAKLCARYQEAGVVGFDLAGPEMGYPIKNHQEALWFAKKNQLFITLHAGESCGPQSIFEAIHDGFAMRIGHGTSLTKDSRLLDYVADHRIGIEACPISNWHTGAVQSLAKHPIREFLDHDLRVSISTDNRLCSDTTVTQELAAVIRNLDLSLSNIKHLLANGFKTAFLPRKHRAKLLRRFNEDWENMRAQL